MRPKETIHLSWVHAGNVDALFMTSVLDTIKHYPTTIGSYNAIQGLGLLARSRNIAVKHFLEETTDDWMLMIDSDEYIPQQSIQKLFEAADSYKTPIISGMCYTLTEPYNATLAPVPCIFKYAEDGESFVINYEYKKNSVIEVAACGTGCLLVHRSVLEKMREDNKEQYGEDWAWFGDGPIEGNQWLGEDLMFCRRAHKSGYTIYAHTGAILPHHKPIWVSEANYEKWVQEFNASHPKFP